MISLLLPMSSMRRRTLTTPLRHCGQAKRSYGNRAADDTISRIRHYKSGKSGPGEAFRTLAIAHQLTAAISEIEADTSRPYWQSPGPPIGAANLQASGPVRLSNSIAERGPRSSRQGSVAIYPNWQERLLKQGF